MKKNSLYAKEITRPVKKNGKVVGWNIVRLTYDKDDRLVGEQMIGFIEKKTN